MLAREMQPENAAYILLLSDRTTSLMLAEIARCCCCRRTALHPTPLWRTAYSGGSEAAVCDMLPLLSSPLLSAKERYTSVLLFTSGAWPHAQTPAESGCHLQQQKEACLVEVNHVR